MRRGEATYPSATLMRPYRMRKGMPCSSTVEVGGKDLRCQRQHVSASRAHRAHVWKRSLRDGGEMIVRWTEVVDVRREAS